MAVEQKLEFGKDYTVVAGQIKEIPADLKVGKEGLIDTVIRKQEMFGSGDSKSYETMLEELKAKKESEAEADKLSTVAAKSTTTSKTTSNKTEKISSLV